jgi:hypothetical protein
MLSETFGFAMNANTKQIEKKRRLGTQRIEISLGHSEAIPKADEAMRIKQ